MHLKIFQNSISNLQYKRTRRTCQQFFEKDIIPVVSLPFQYLSAQHKNKLAILNILSRYENYYGRNSIYPSQQEIADEVNVSRQYVNEVMGEFVTAGIIGSNYRHKQTCQYKFSSYFNLLEVRRSLSHIIPAFSWLNIAVLATSLVQAETYKNIPTTQIKSPFVFIQSLSSGYSMKERLSTKRVVKKENFMHSHRKKERFFMNNPIMPEIRHIPNVKFTVREQIALSAFPKEAILDAVKKLKFAKNIRLPFAWIRKVCREYCESNEIQPNYDWVFQLDAAYKSNPDQFLIKNDESPYKTEVVEPVAKTNPSKYNAAYEPLKQVNQSKYSYKKALDAYKKTKSDNHYLNKKQFEDEWTEQEILMELRKFEEYGKPENMKNLIALWGHKAAYDYLDRATQNWRDKLAQVTKQTPANPVQILSAIETKQNIGPEYGPNYNDDEMYEEIIEGPIW